MKKNVKIFLEHVLEAISLIEKYIEDMEKSDFLRSTQLQDSVIRRIEIIGEAMKNIPSDFKDSHANLPEIYVILK